MAISGLEDFKKLEIERDNLEVEISGLYEYLTQDGMPGVSGSLVDAEGFPRADLDLYAIRKARHRLACAQTDHKEVMKSIEAALVAIHAGSRVSVPRAQPAAPARAAVDEDGAVAAPVSMPPVPWAVIDEIAEGSPAQEAGLELGDLLCRFGDIDRHDTGDVSACKAAIAAARAAERWPALGRDGVEGQPSHAGRVDADAQAVARQRAARVPPNDEDGLSSARRGADVRGYGGASRAVPRASLESGAHRRCPFLHRRGAA
eukprot:CAMPEP_0176300530 /NCGR_PEP_ID=MMETSP0121_2-20121125/60368_1 /TAXON_ID=160619 /ORGANISM="Kryptoperidinium foliaceum, Strain CCMP 1326" /LENGTH=259 /DNA_ID=CAMNT_0017641919 /DNA_START=55 /DNA_END=829 /DNA_ORIENTATION=+